MIVIHVSSFELIYLDVYVDTVIYERLDGSNPEIQRKTTDHLNVIYNVYSINVITGNFILI